MTELNKQYTGQVSHLILKMSEKLVSTATRMLPARFSGWLSLFYFPNEVSATDLIRNLKDYFTTFGIAEHFASDGGPQFQPSIFQNFLKSWGIQIAI